MALSLDQVKTHKKKTKESFKVNEPSKVIRPWETKKELGLSHSGLNAVKKAQDIVSKNEKMVEEIRGSFVSKQKAKEVDEQISKKVTEFDSLVKEAGEINQIKVSKGIFGQIKKIFAGGY